MRGMIFISTEDKVQYKDYKREKSNIEILEILNSLDDGSKITYTISSLFGFMTCKKGTLVRKPYQHGFLLPSGSWGAYQHVGDVPCYAIDIRPYKKKNIYRLKIGFDLFDIKKGWEKV